MLDALHEKRIVSTPALASQGRLGQTPPTSEVAEHWGIQVFPGVRVGPGPARDAGVSSLPIWAGSRYVRTADRGCPWVPAFTPTVVTRDITNPKGARTGNRTALIIKDVRVQNEQQSRCFTMRDPSNEAS
jgi:hypothetical protein